MEESITENTKTIRKKDLVLSHGLMEESMLVTGDKENNTERVPTPPLKEKKNTANGRTERESDGLIKLSSMHNNLVN